MIVVSEDWLPPGDLAELDRRELGEPSQEVAESLEAHGIAVLFACGLE